MMLKRAEVILTVLLVALNCGAGVISFVLPSCVGHVARPSQLIIGRSHGYKTQCPAVSETAAQDTSGSPLSGNPLPPKDETFSPQGSLFELLEAPVPPQSCGRFDGVGKKTGGIWRSRVLGFMPSTVRSGGPDGHCPKLYVVVNLTRKISRYFFFSDNFEQHNVLRLQTTLPKSSRCSLYS